MGTTSEKLTYLNGTKQKLKQAINNIGGEVTDKTTFREYVNQLENAYDRLPKTEFEEGESVTLENTLKGKLDFQDGKVGFGQAKQETTQGYNLIDVTSGTIVTNVVTGVTASMSGDVITLNGTRGDGNTDPKRFIDNLDKFGTLTSGRTYRMSLNNISGTFNGGIAITFRDASGQIEYIQTSNGGTSATRELTFSRSVTYIRIVVTGSFTASNFKFQLMLQDTTEEKPYEPYTGGYSSPSPNWEQEIKYVRGKNLFNKATVTQRSYIDAQGVLKGADGTYCASDYIEVYQGSIVWSATTGNGYSLSIYDSSKTFIRSVGRTGNNAMVIPIANGEKYIRFTLLTADLDITQIEEGSTATPYLPYNTIQEIVYGKNLIGFGIRLNGYRNVETAKFVETSGDNVAGFYFKTSVLPNNVAISSNGGNRVNLSYYNEVPATGVTAQAYNNQNVESRAVTISKNYTYVHIQFSYNQACSDFQVEEGSEVTPYQPFSLKPYQFSLGDHKFYGIGTYRDYILRTTGKNLLNIANFEEGYSIGFDGLPGAYTTTARITNTTPIDVEGLDKVTLSFTAWTGGDKFIYSLLKSDNTLVARETAKTSGTTITIGEAKYLYICFYDGATLSNVKDAMLVKGSTAMDFQPYGSGNWYKYANVGEVVLDGVNNSFINRFSADVSTKYRFVWNDTINGIKNLGNTTKTTLCDKLKQTTAAENYARVEGIAANSNVLVYVEEISEYSVENANQWLQNNVLDVYYLLNIPILTPITGTLAEQLEEWWNGQSLDGTTIIEGNGDLPMIIKVRGLKGE